MGNSNAAVELSQRTIYDQRYCCDGYDRRSAVRGPAAESEALRAAVRRATQTFPEPSVVSVLDFGSGTGRVTAEFAVEYPVRFARSGRDLRVVAYDLSGEGLAETADLLRDNYSFRADGELRFRPDRRGGYVAGSLRKAVCGIELTVVLVHGDEREGPAAMERLVREANDGEQFLVSTSWSGGLGHVVGVARRDAYLAALDAVTRPAGELALAVSSTGDLVEAQARWARRLRRGDTGGCPVEVPGDVMYSPEPGRDSYYHVFGPDLEAHLRRICGPGQRWWVEAVRLSDDEPGSVARERANHRKVLDHNRRKAGLPWTPADYRACRGVVAFRSAAVNAPGPDGR